MPIISTGPCVSYTESWHLFTEWQADPNRLIPSLHRHLKGCVLSLTALLSWSYRPPDKEEEEEKLLTVVQLTTEEVSKGTAYQAAYFREGFFFFFYLNPP